MPSLTGRAARLLKLTEKERIALSVRLRSLIPHRGFREHQRVPLWHPDVPFVLITSQRAGSTLGTAWFLHHAGLLEEAKALDTFVHRYEQDVFLRQADYMDGLKAALEEKPVFKLVREPGARAFSSYLHLHSPQAEDPKDHRFTLRRRILRSIGKPTTLQTPLPFTAFLRWLASCDHDRIDGHEARQVNRYEAELPGGRPEPIKLEYAMSALPKIEEALGLPVTPQSQLKALGASGHYIPRQGPEGRIAEILDVGLTVPRSGTFPVIETRTLIPYPEAHAALVSAFENDYLAFGYPRYLKGEGEG